MTENEARLILDVRISRFDHAGDVNEALEIAKQALEEIQHYRAIGTVEECREAVEKQNYMKIKTIEDMCFEYPKCKELVAHDDGWNTYNYCPNCGQKLSGIE